VTERELYTSTDGEPGSGGQVSTNSHTVAAIGNGDTSSQSLEGNRWMEIIPWVCVTPGAYCFFHDFWCLWTSPRSPAHTTAPLIRYGTGNSRSFPIQDHDQYRLSHAQQARLRLHDRRASRDVSVVTGSSTDLQASLGRRACSTVTCANPLSNSSHAQLMYEMKVPAIATKQSNSTDEKPRKSGAMPAHRPPANSPQNHPTTPVAPRVKAPQRITPSPSASLHPNITTRSPKGSVPSTTWRARADSAAAPGSTTLNTAPAPRPYVVRPTSSASVRTITRPESTNTSTNGSSGRLSVSNGSQMFFHASEANVPISTPQPHSPYSAPQAQSTGPKFFHADGAEAAEGPVEPYRRRTRGLSSSPQLTSNIPMLPPGPPPRNENNSPTPSSRPTSTAFVNLRTLSLAPSLTPTPPELRNHVKFVYADGAEEVLEPRTQTSDSASTSTSPQFPASPTFSGSSNGASPVKVAYPISPLASPNAFNSPPQYPQRHTTQSSSRRTSLDLKVRHDRAVSISSVIEMSSSTEEIQGSDNLEQQTSEDMGYSEDEGEDDERPEGTRSPLPMTAAERIKEMEARAANARRERKVHFH
jgi:hypothetical protein